MAAVPEPTDRHRRWSRFGPFWPVGLLRQQTGTSRSSGVQLWRSRRQRCAISSMRPRRIALKRFWTTIRRLRRRKQCTVNTKYGGYGVLLTATRDIVDRWKEYWEDLLNLTNTPELGPHCWQSDFFPSRVGPLGELPFVTDSVHNLYGQAF